LAQARFCHHNFRHVSRVLHRALLIAAEQPKVDYGVLIPAVLLHDIGFCSGDWRNLGHERAGARLARDILAGLGYQAHEVEAICLCIEAHKGEGAGPRSLEAKILYDADVLEKAGLFDLAIMGLLMCEFGEDIKDCLARERLHRGRELARGFYTSRGRELDGGRLARVKELFDEMHAELNGPRPDFLVTEDDLWQQPPGNEAQ